MISLIPVPGPHPAMRDPKAEKFLGPKVFPPNQIDCESEVQAVPG